MVTQQYQTDAHSVYVIVGNSALLKCEIPSFVADFVSVYSWTDNDNNEYFMGINKNYGKQQRIKSNVLFDFEDKSSSQA